MNTIADVLGLMDDAVKSEEEIKIDVQDEINRLTKVKDEEIESIESWFEDGVWSLENKRDDDISSTEREYQRAILELKASVTVSVSPDQLNLLEVS